MVNDYQYENLFTEHFAADYIIVDSSASVTINAGIAPTISGEEFLITNAELQSETIKLHESLCSENNLVFGKMEASKLTFTFKNKTDYPTNLTGEEIDVYLYFDYDSSTLFKVGRYTINSDKYSDDRYTRSITAYDQIYYLKDLDITEWYNAYYEDGQRHMIGLAILNLFDWIRDPNDDYPNSPKINIQIESGYSLCNGTFLLGKTIESDSITFEFYMQKLLEFNGAFGHINRQGNFEFVVMQWYDAEPVRTITNDYRIPPTPFDIVSTWGIGGIDVYAADNIRKFSIRNTNKNKPSIYVIVDSFVLADRDSGDADVETALKKMHQVINHYNYKSCKTTCTGNLCVEVGDRINVNLIEGEIEQLDWFRSYVLERTFSGIQGMTDVYQAKGDQKQPAYIVDNDNWHVGESSASTSGSGTGGVSELRDEHDRRLIEIMRNYGQPMLDEPTVELTYNKGDSQVEIKWTDPADITSYSPLPVEWAGTIVVRKEGSQPIHRWGTEHSPFGGTLLVDSTTRDEYSVTAYADDTIEPNKRYYYAIMPYFVALDDEYHPVKHYRWTKVYSVDTTRILVAPTIYPIQDSQISGTTVTVAYTIPTLTEGSYTLKKLVVKKNSIPTSKTDGDKIIDLTPDPSLLINGVDVSGLDENSHYFFVIFVEDEIGSSASSEPRECQIGEIIPKPSWLNPDESEEIYISVGYGGTSGNNVKLKTIGFVNQEAQRLGFNSWIAFGIGVFSNYHAYIIYYFNATQTSDYYVCNSDYDNTIRVGLLNPPLLQNIEGYGFSGDTATQLSNVTTTKYPDLTAHSKTIAGKNYNTVISSDADIGTANFKVNIGLTSGELYYNGIKVVE